jgi:DNA (cytosine-5)-methyltransferase 1
MPDEDARGGCCIVSEGKMLIQAVDLFAGAGGTSTGLIQACKALRYELHLTAINHWDVAISTHEMNHPGVDHLCQNLNNVNPLQVVPGGYLDLLVASPECTHHSIARGGKPMDEQSRAGADFVCIWAEKLYIENILIENVKEFMTWGPLDKNRRPIPRLKGQLFLNFIERLKALDYNVEYRVINSANYGDATTRERLFILARKSHKVVKWPEPTHSKEGDLGFLAQTKKWRPAREIIDWEIKSRSIFDRKKPLSENTMRRIKKGLEKFGGQPFLSEYHGASYEGGERVRSVNKPMPTIATCNQFGLCQPFIISTAWGQTNRSIARSIDDPIPTIVAQNNSLHLCQPYIVKMYGTANASSINQPLPTIVGGGGHLYLAEPFLVNYNGTGVAHSVEEPLPTITSKDRFGLVMPLADGREAIFDVLFRMLTPKELAAAMSFPPDYKFTGGRDSQVKQIGNAVAVRTAKALCSALLS